MYKRSPKIGCGPFGARTLFSGILSIFREVLIFTPMGSEACARARQKPRKETYEVSA